jgi:hypothetical protein
LKVPKLILISLQLLSFSFADELAVLESFQIRDSKAFTNMYQGFECQVDEEGAFWVVYSLTRDNEWPQYLIDCYRPGRNFPAKDLGAYYGEGGWYDPVLCRISGTTLETQVFVSNDYGRKMQYHELTSLNYSQEASNQIQYPGGVSKTSLCHIQKITDTTASAYSLEWSETGDPLSVKFLKDFKLYNLWPDDYSGPFLEADTLWESESPATFVYDERIKGTNVMAALYRHWEDDNWLFVCVDNERVLFETEQALPGSMLNVSLRAGADGFFIAWQEKKNGNIFIKEYNPKTNIFTQGRILFPVDNHGLQVTSEYEFAIDTKHVYLQFPILSVKGSSQVANWTSILRHTIQRSDLKLLKTDTMISFPGPRDYSCHRITTQAGLPHSLIITNDGLRSQLLYFGPINF